MIAIDNLVFRHPGSDFELKIDSLKIGQAQSVALVGPSGSGKTSLLHLIGGIRTEYSGTIRVGDRDLKSLSDSACRDFRAAEIGIVFQDFALLDYLNGRDNLLLTYRISPMRTLDESVRKRAVELAATLGVAGVLDRPVGKLSHGERQRIAIARALLGNPKLILADEPTGNLDPENKSLALDALLSPAKEIGATVIVATHDRDLLDRFDRVVDLSCGGAA